MRKPSFIATDWRGFTLVEMLVAMTMASLVGMAAYAVFVSSSRSSVAQEDVSETQQNARVVMDYLSRDIRAAGFGLPNPPFSISIGGQTLTSPVSITNSAAGPDSITLLGGGEELFWLDSDSDCSNTDSDPTNDCNLPDKDDSTTSHPAASTTINITGDDANVLDDFFIGGAFNPSRTHISIGGMYYNRVTNIVRAGMYATLTLAFPLDRAYVDGTPVYLIKAFRYTIDTGTLAACSATNPCAARQDLAQNNQVLALDIEDMQFAHALKDTATFVNNASSSDIDIVAVRANVVGRTRRPVPGVAAGYARPALEDRPAGVNDAFRRRVLTSVIKVRNPKTGS